MTIEIIRKDFNEVVKAFDSKNWLETLEKIEDCELIAKSYDYEIKIVVTELIDYDYDNHPITSQFEIDGWYMPMFWASPNALDMGWVIHKFKTAHEALKAWANNLQGGTAFYVHYPTPFPLKQGDFKNAPIIEKGGAQ